MYLYNFLCLFYIYLLTFFIMKKNISAIVFCMFLLSLLTVSTYAADETLSTESEAEYEAIEAQDHNGSRSNTTSSVVEKEEEEEEWDGDMEQDRAQDHNATRSNKTSPIMDNWDDEWEEWDDDMVQDRAQDHNATRSNKTSPIMDNWDDEWEEWDDESRVYMHIEWIKWEAKEKRAEKNDEMEERRDEVRLNRIDMASKDDLEDTFWELEEELKEELKDLYEEQKEEMEKLREEYEDSDDMEVFSEEFLQASANLRAEHYAELTELLWDDAEALAMVRERENIFIENEKLRKQNVEARKEYRWEKSWEIQEHKEKLIDRIGGKLDKFPVESLESLLVKIEEFIVRIEENDDMSEERKELINQMLIALQEMIEEQLDMTDSEADILNFDEIFDL